MAADPNHEALERLRLRLRKRRGGWKSNISYASDAGPLVNPDGPEADTAIETLLAEIKRLREALEPLVDEFGCSLNLLERNGPDLSCADGEFVHALVLTDRADLIARARAALNPSETQHAQ